MLVHYFRRVRELLVQTSRKAIWCLENGMIYGNLDIWKKVLISFFIIFISEP
jgi:hypothetical protein